MSEKDINKAPEKNTDKKKLQQSPGDFFKGKGNKNTLYIFIAIAIGFFILQFALKQETAKEISQLRFETKMMSKPVTSTEVG